MKSHTCRGQALYKECGRQEINVRLSTFGWWFILPKLEETSQFQITGSSRNIAPFKGDAMIWLQLAELNMCVTDNEFGKVNKAFLTFILEPPRLKITLRNREF